MDEFDRGCMEGLADRENVAFGTHWLNHSRLVETNRIASKKQVGSAPNLSILKRLFANEKTAQK